MIYAKRKMLSYLDPRMLSVYEESNPVEAANLLQKMGIKYIHIPDYGLPVYYNSVISRLVAQPALTTLVHSSGGTMIFELTDSGKRAEKIEDITPGVVIWTRSTQALVGGRKFLEALRLQAELMDENQISDTRATVPFAHRDFSTLFSNGIGSSFSRPKLDTLFRVEEGQEYRIDLELKGEAYVRILMIQLSVEGELISWGGAWKEDKSINTLQRIGEIILEDTYESKHFAFRFVPLPEAKYIRIGVAHLGYSVLKIENASVYQLHAGHLD